MTITAKQRQVLNAIVAADRPVYLRDIGRLQSAGVEVDGEPIPRSARSFEALRAARLVGIHRDDTGFGAPAAQRIYVTAAGRALAAEGAT